MINYIQVYLLPDNLAEFRLMISELILIDTWIQIEDSYYLNLLSTKQTTSLIITVALSDNTKYTKKGIWLFNQPDPIILYRKNLLLSSIYFASNLVIL
jgi:hypothetical protein